MIKIVVVGAALLVVSAAAQAQGLGGLAQGLLAAQAIQSGRPYVPPPQYYAPQYVPQFQGPQFHNYNLPNGGSLHCTTMGQPPYQTTNCY